MKRYFNYKRAKARNNVLCIIGAMVSGAWFVLYCAFNWHEWDVEDKFMALIGLIIWVVFWPLVHTFIGSIIFDKECEVKKMKPVPRIKGDAPLPEPPKKKKFF